MGTYETDNFPSNIVVREDIVFTAERQFGLTVLNVEDPFNPIPIESYEAPSLHASYLALNYPYIYLSTTRDGLHVIIVSDPEDPIEVGVHFPPLWIGHAMVNQDIEYTGNHTVTIGGGRDYAF